jgi:RHS repeat-associated protein
LETKRARRPWSRRREDSRGSVSCEGGRARVGTQDTWGNFRFPDDLTSTANRFAFTGHIFDTETGLYYAKARYFDPKLGRFLTQDSFLGQIDEPPSLHRYLYANDNPTRYIDPSGHQGIGAAGRQSVDQLEQGGNPVVYTDEQGGKIVIRDPNAPVNRLKRETAAQLRARWARNAPDAEVVVEEDAQQPQEEGPWRGTNAVTRPLARGLNWAEKQVDRVMAPINEAEEVAADYYEEQARAWTKKKLKPGEHGAFEQSHEATQEGGVPDPHANIAKGFQETGGDVIGAGAYGFTIGIAETGKFIVTDGAGRVVEGFADEATARRFIATREAELAKASRGTQMAARETEALAARGVNRLGSSYPVVKDVRTGTPIPFPEGAALQRVPKADRVAWGLKERGEYIGEWYRRGYQTPSGGWELYDIHHIRPREFGGTNAFENLAPVERSVEHQRFNRFWESYWWAAAYRIRWRSSPV